MSAVVSPYQSPREMQSGSPTEMEDMQRSDSSSAIQDMESGDCSTEIEHGIVPPSPQLPSEPSSSHNTAVPTPSRPVETARIQTIDDRTRGIIVKQYAEDNFLHNGPHCEELIFKCKHCAVHPETVPNDWHS